MAPTIVDQDETGSYRVVGRQDQYSLVAGRLVRQVWREASPSLLAAPPTLIDTVEHMLRSRARRRVMVRWTTQTLGSVTVAGVVAAVVLVCSRRPLTSPQEAGDLKHPSSVAADHQPTARPSRRDPRSMFVETAADGTAWALDKGAIEPGARLSAPETGPVRIASAEGTELTLEPGASLTVAETGATKRFTLTRGAVQAHVKKLLADERFIVQTTDAEVEVHGTQFGVITGQAEPACGKTKTTRVLVSEGIVTVRSSSHEERLFPGDDWQSKCVAQSVQRDDSRAPRRTSGPALSPRAGSTANRIVALSPRANRAAQALPAMQVSALAAQNELFRTAVRAKRTGRVADAVNLFERFVRDYPSSSLVESAVAQRMRLLARRDPEAAARAAAEYLDHFPDGFARGEAHTIVTANARF